ncbi:MAG TPA: LL-diaminopimelate aminotransferase [Clostridiales bacterium]|nr:MAG: LL-diaminopimelate aminotransferase [Candidatus Margulisbacteria bacterium GWF2_35_9]HAN20713.1 LL-diaminopimelate aminotransferase [Clostridiales bacterium]
MKINSNFNNLQESYLFFNIAKKTKEFIEKNPAAPIIRMGIGDVTLPLPAACVNAMEKASVEMGVKETFKGYGEYEGFAFLRQAISDYYKEYNVIVGIDEIFISDGAKSDLGNILDIFDDDNIVMVPDPVYPVYVDTNIMAGRKVIFSDANESNGFTPAPDKSVKADIIYICSPNNPTGAAYDKAGLKAWVDYANEQGAVILFDAAYEAFISDKEIPHSIFEIEGAKTCAIEFCSFSKTAGFTGTRCGYTVVPKELVREGRKLGDLWLRRQSTKYNGTPYIIQRGAEAVFTSEGRQQIKENIDYYKQNCVILSEVFAEKGIKFFGGKNSPYIWLKCPGGMKSWEFFDFFISKCNIVGTPGSGFGNNGEGYFRLTGFGSRENTLIAADRIKKTL